MPTLKKKTGRFTQMKAEAFAPPPGRFSEMRAVSQPSGRFSQMKAAAFPEETPLESSDAGGGDQRQPGAPLSDVRRVPTVTPSMPGLDRLSPPSDLSAPPSYSDLRSVGLGVGQRSPGLHPFDMPTREDIVEEEHPVLAPAARVMTRAGAPMVDAFSAIPNAMGAAIDYIAPVQEQPGVINEPSRIPSVGEFAESRGTSLAPRSTGEAIVGGTAELGGNVAALANPVNPLNVVGKAVSGAGTKAAQYLSKISPRGSVLATGKIGAGVAERAGQFGGFLAGYELPAQAETAIRSSLESGDIYGPTGAMAKSLATAGPRLLVEVVRSIPELGNNIAKIVASSDIDTINEGFQGIGPLAMLAGVHLANRGGAPRVKPQTTEVDVGNVPGRTPEVKPVQDVAGNTVKSATGNEAIATDRGTTRVTQAPVELSRGGARGAEPLELKTRNSKLETGPAEAGAERVTLNPQKGEFHEQGTTQEARQRGQHEQPQQYAEGQKPDAVDAQEAPQFEGAVKAGAVKLAATGSLPSPRGAEGAAAVPKLVGKTPVDKLRNRARRIAEEGITDASIGEPEVSALPTNRPRILQEAGDGKVEVTAPDIIKTLEQVGGAPIRSKLYNTRIGGGKALGIFKHPAHTIRLGENLDLQTAAHEAGHALHNLARQMRVNLPAPVAKELFQLGYELYGLQKSGKPYSKAVYLKEGIAEYVAQRLIGDNPGQKFPEAHKWVEQNLLADPARRAAMDRAQGQFRQWSDQGSQARVQAHIAEPPGRIREAYEKLRDRLTPRWLYNELDPLEKAVNRAMAQAGMKEGDIPPSKNPAKVAAALKGNSAGIARHFVFDGAVDHAGNVVGPSLVEALRPVRHRLREWTRYAVARRAIIYAERGMKSGIDLRDAQNTVRELESPEFRKALDDATEWSRRLLDYVQEAGGLSPEVREIIDSLNPIYVPYQREFGRDYPKMERGPGGGRGFADVANPVKRSHGSGRRIKNPVVEFVRQAEVLVSAANKMRIFNAMRDFGRMVPGSGFVIEKVDLPKERTTFKLEEIRKQLESQGIELGGADFDQLLSVFDNAQRYHGPENVVSGWRNGKREFFEVDPRLYEVVKDLDGAEIGPIASLLSAPKRWVQLGATGINPAFGIRNLWKDMFHATVYSRENKRNPADSFVGIFESLRNGEWARMAKATGLEMATMMGQDRAEANKSLKMSLAFGAKEKAVRTFTHPVSAPVDALRAVMEHIEKAPRLVELRDAYRRAKQKPGYTDLDAKIEAMNAFKDVTVNFTRAGIYSRSLNRWIPFFNANVQGIEKFFRTFGGALSGDPDAKRQALRATAKAVSFLTLPTLALWWVNKDQEWYRRRKRWEKANFWLFSVNDGETVFRIPKPYGLGNVFSSMPEAVVDLMYRGGDEESRRNFSGQVAEMVKAFIPINGWADFLGAGKPWAEAYFNYDDFRDRPIETEQDQELLRPDRYDEWTTETAKSLGKAFNVSPKKLEHVLSGATGGMALTLTRWAEQLSGSKTLTREKVAPDVPVIGTFFARPDSQVRPQQVDDFYEQLQTLRQKSNSKAISSEEARRLKESEKILKLGKIENLRKKIKRATGIARTQLQRQLDREIDGEVKKRRVLEKVSGG